MDDNALKNYSSCLYTWKDFSWHAFTEPGSYHINVNDLYRLQIDEVTMVEKTGLCKLKYYLIRRDNNQIEDSEIINRNKELSQHISIIVSNFIHALRVITQA